MNLNHEIGNLNWCNGFLKNCVKESERIDKMYERSITYMDYWIMEFKPYIFG